MTLSPYGRERFSLNSSYLHPGNYIKTTPLFTYIKKVRTMKNFGKDLLKSLHQAIEHAKENQKNSDTANKSLKENKEKQKPEK